MSEDKSRSTSLDPIISAKTESFKVSRKTARPLKDENNYPAWTTDIKRIIRLLKLKDALDKDKQIVYSTEQWEELSDKAMTIILENCDESIQDLVIAYEFAHEAWSILKEHFEGRTRTHLTALLQAITSLKFDDRKGTIQEHIAAFESRWNALRQNVASETASATSQAGAIKNFANNDAWKASMLLLSLPNISSYENIVNNITSSSEEPSYAKVVLRLRELSQRSHHRKDATTPTAPQAAFATSQYATKTCTYCRSKGYPGKGHEESECRTKIRDANRKTQQAHDTSTTSENHWADVFATTIDIKGAFTTTTKDEGWWVDSCSSIHITYDPSDLLTKTPHVQGIRTGGGEMYSTDIGIAKVHGITLHNVYLVPGFCKKLISVGRINEKGGHVNLGYQGKYELYHEATTIPLIPVGPLYKLASNEPVVHLTDVEWHERYAHLPFPAFEHIPEAPVHLRKITTPCEACITGKTTKPWATNHGEIRTSQVGELMLSDLCGPLGTESIHHNKYIVTLIDNTSRLTMTRAIKAKSDAGEALKEMIAAFRNFSGKPISALQTDFGGEYKSNTLREWLRKEGIAEKPTVPHHSQTNAVAERTNR